MPRCRDTARTTRNGAQTLTSEMRAFLGHAYNLKAIANYETEPGAKVTPAQATDLHGDGCLIGFVESYKTAKTLPADPGLVMGCHDANRLMAMSGTTSLVDNAPLFLPDQPLVYDWLTEHDISWCACPSGNFLPFFALMPKWQDTIGTSLALDFLVAHAHPKFRRFSNFQRDWSTEQDMPQVIHIEPE